MNKSKHTGLREATRLTQAGRLLEATAAIQRTLRGISESELRPDTTQQTTEPFIEGTFQVIDKKPNSPIIILPEQSKQRRQSKEQFLTGSYTNEAGTRPYKLYIPSGYQGQSLPLVVMLHGCTQSPDDFAAGTRMNELAENQLFFVLYPAQAANANGSKCWNWFKASEQQRDQGEPALIAGLTRQVISTYGVDGRQVYIAGLSAGGAMAMIMGITYPDLYAALGIHSGLAYGVAQDFASAFTVMRQGLAGSAALPSTTIPGGKTDLRLVPTIVFHGDQDSTVHPSNSNQIIAQWLKIRAKGGTPGSKPKIAVYRGQVPTGYTYTRSVYHEVKGQPFMEQWLIHGAGHAWSGGSPKGSFTEAKGPAATQEMIRFFFEHPHPKE